MCERQTTEEKLESETRKWLARLDETMKRATPSQSSLLEKKAVNRCMENARAYAKDCRHFLEKRDYVNAFEAVIYAWGILETLEMTGLVRVADAA